MHRPIMRILPVMFALAIGLPAHAAPVTYTGMCDASAAVLLDSDRFVVANDEDNLLRTYSLSRPGAPLASLDVGAFLGADKEADIEGVARTGNRIWWVTSHGANKNGKPRPDRHRLFATDVQDGAGGVALTPYGAGHRTLDALFSGSIGKRYGLEQAARQAPESTGGLNIEGLAAAPSGGLLIGLRSPVPGGRALIVPLANADAYLASNGDNAVAPVFGEAIVLDLGKRGIRSIDLVPGTRDYLIVAGPPGPAKSGTFALFGWRMGKPPVPLKTDWPPDFRPEALMVDGAGKMLHVLSDDGDDCGKPPAFRLLSTPLPVW